MLYAVVCISVYNRDIDMDIDIDIQSKGLKITESIECPCRDNGE